MEERPPIWRAAPNILSSGGQPTRGGLPTWGFDEVLTTPHRKKKVSCYEMFTKRQGQVAGTCECDNDSDSIKGGEFLENQLDSQGEFCSIK